MGCVFFVLRDTSSLALASNQYNNLCGQWASISSAHLLRCDTARIYICVHYAMDVNRNNVLWDWRPPKNELQHLLCSLNWSSHAQSNGFTTLSSWWSFIYMSLLTVFGTHTHVSSSKRMIIQPQPQVVSFHLPRVPPAVASNHNRQRPTAPSHIIFFHFHSNAHANSSFVKGSREREYSSSHRCPETSQRTNWETTCCRKCDRRRRRKKWNDYISDQKRRRRDTFIRLLSHRFGWQFSFHHCLQFVGETFKAVFGWFILYIW